MKRFLSFALLAGMVTMTATAEAQTHNTLSKKEKKQGWKLLFDGKSTDGWHVFKRPTKPSAWKVEDGVLFLDTDAKKSGAAGGDLVTDGEFENYEMQLEWKISEAGNSGIIFGVNEDPKYGATYSTGPEMQIIDDEGHPDGKHKKHNAGELYDMVQAPARYAKPVGEWNTAKIIKKNGKLTLVFNGKVTAEVVMGSPEWQTLIDNSKFKTWKGFGEYPKGHIALQDHGDKVWFRNIKIREL